MSKEDSVRNPILFEIRKPDPVGEHISEVIDAVEQVCADDLGCEFMGCLEISSITDSLETALETVKEQIATLERGTGTSLKPEITRIKTCLVKFKMAAEVIIENLEPQVEELDERLAELTAAVDFLKYRAGIRTATLATGSGNHVEVTTVPGQVDWPDSVSLEAMISEELDATEEVHGGGKITLSVNS